MARRAVHSNPEVLNFKKKKNQQELRVCFTFKLLALSPKRRSSDWKPELADRALKIP